MSKMYDEYLHEHRQNVIRAYEWLKENIPSIFELVSPGIDIEHRIVFSHDSSKNSVYEYDAYDRYFYGYTRSYQVVSDFNYAWLHHIHNNPHHWQHWVLISDEANEGTKVLDMPMNYIIEMICDWWAFSWKSGDLFSIFNWYREHSSNMQLSEETRMRVTQILTAMREKLNASQKYVEY